MVFHYHALLPSDEKLEGGSCLALRWHVADIDRSPIRRRRREVWNRYAAPKRVHRRLEPRG